MSYLDRDILGMYRNHNGPGPALMGADTLLGDEVYNHNDEELGDIKEIMLDMRTGQIAYAVMTFGGFLGLGEGHHPVPWKKLRYDVNLGGFVTDITHEQLTGAPSWSETWVDDPTYRERSYSYYGVSPYWL